MKGWCCYSIGGDDLRRSLAFPSDARADRGDSSHRLSRYSGDAMRVLPLVAPQRVVLRHTISRFWGLDVCASASKIGILFNARAAALLRRMCVCVCAMCAPLRARLP